MSIEKTYQDLIYVRTYARWNWDLGRREVWPETVNRYVSYFLPRVPEHLKNEFRKAGNLIHDLEIMPSMRALWTAGPALDECDSAAYNCAYTKIDNTKAFSEILYILMQGTGCGFSVERQYITNLPTVPDTIQKSNDAIIFGDSKLGWAKGFDAYLQGLYAGIERPYDLRAIREKGKILKTFGGRASGPGPLIDLLRYTNETIRKAQGRRLTSLECHDMVCFVASVVGAGGVRRSATLSLSNLSDQRMQRAKMGDWWNTHGHRSVANNSVAYTERPDMEIFLNEWSRLMESKSGERGIFNRKSAENIVRMSGRRDVVSDFGCNPCSEIILRPNQFCNLSEIVVRPDDTLDSLTKKTKYATILGTIQSTLVNFKYLGEDWKKNCEEERLLGVSLTGIMDHPVLSNLKKKEELSDWLRIMKGEVLRTAKVWSEALNIPMPTATTCVKPSGSVSQRVNSASGIHPRYSEYYIRRVRISAMDPLSKYLIDRGIPHHPEVGNDAENPKTWVFEYPIKSPEKAVLRNEINAIEQLEHWKLYQEYWCEHKPSITVYVRDHEWLKVGAWVYENWEWISGVSFLPYDGGLYKLAPYEEITSDQYKQLINDFPTMDFKKLVDYEKEDYTEGAKEFACVSGGCEV